MRVAGDTGPAHSVPQVTHMRVLVSCPSRSCSRNLSINGIGRCLSCNAYILAKPSPRRKTMDLRSKGVIWLWKPAPDGDEVIVTHSAELDPEGMERTVIESERGRWVRIAPGIVRLAPDFRKTGIDPLPYLRNLRIVEDKCVCTGCDDPTCKDRNSWRTVCTWYEGDDDAV